MRTELVKTEMDIQDRTGHTSGPNWTCPLRSSGPKWVTTSVLRTEMGGPKWARTEMGGHHWLTEMGGHHWLY